MKPPVPLSAVQLAARAAFGAGIALTLAGWLGLPHPIYAMLAAVIVTDLSPAQTRELGLRRLVATFVGAGCGALLAAFLPPGPWSAALGIALSILICEALHASEGARVAGYISGIVLLAYAADPWTYALFRLLETLLGIGVAWTISLVPRLLAAPE